jgi:hypothetical protein
VGGTSLRGTGGVQWRASPCRTWTVDTRASPGWPIGVQELSKRRDVGYSSLGKVIQRVIGI